VIRFFKNFSDCDFVSNPPTPPTYEKRHGVQDTQFGAEGRRLLVGGGVGLGHLQNTVLNIFINKNF
jgi:hypothetical protein